MGRPGVIGIAFFPLIIFACTRTVADFGIDKMYELSMLTGLICSSAENTFSQNDEAISYELVPFKTTSPISPAIKAFTGGSTISFTMAVSIVGHTFNFVPIAKHPHSTRIRQKIPFGSSLISTTDARRGRALKADLFGGVIVLKDSYTRISKVKFKNIYI